MVDDDVRVARIWILLAAAMLLAGCRDADLAPGSSRSDHIRPRPARSETMTWERAEEIARQYLVDEGSVPAGGGTAAYERNDRAKFLFRYGHLLVLVHRGEVLPRSGGVSALSRYVWETPESERQALRAEDAVDLVGYFTAYPPVKDGEPFGFYGDPSADRFRPDEPALHAHVAWSQERASFRIYYDVTRNEDQIPDVDLRTLAEWTLTLSPDGTGVWTEHERRYHRAQKQFVE
jgi:hypothetical protein